MSDLPRIAIIADAHFHDLEGDLEFPRIEIDGEKLAVRSWTDTRESTRVFNESAKALDEALAEIARRGIRHVVLLGDYTDDGQRQTTARLRTILDGHESTHGTRFYALPGNHDIFGPKGRHHTKQFLDRNDVRVLVTSDVGKAAPGSHATPRMYCEGYPTGLAPVATHGYFRRPDYLHWETPFGASDRVEDRLYPVSSPDGRNGYRLMDASYLVEPEPGLWLLMIDANVFEPRDGLFEEGDEAAFVDSTGAGWNALIRLKPFIVDWIADVSARFIACSPNTSAVRPGPAGTDRHQASWRSSSGPSTPSSIVPKREACTSASRAPPTRKRLPDHGPVALHGLFLRAAGDFHRVAGILPSGPTSSEGWAPGSGQVRACPSVRRRLCERTGSGRAQRCLDDDSHAARQRPRL